MLSGSETTSSSRYFFQHLEISGEMNHNTPQRSRRKNNTQPKRGSRYEMGTRLQKKRLPAPDKNHSSLHPGTGYLTGRWPKRTHRAGDLTLCRPLPTPKPTIEFLLLLRRLAAGAAQHARLAEASSAVVLSISRPPTLEPRFPHATVASCSTPPGAMPLPTTGLQGLAEWHLVCLCRSSQRLIASSDPTLNQRTPSSGRLPITGCALHTERCHHTPRQKHRQDRHSGAILCPCAEITTQGQCIGS